MRLPTVDDPVRLRRDIPELQLHIGDLGVVRSTWFSPSVAYEVEFQQVGLSQNTRALLLSDQIELAPEMAM